MVCGVKPKLCRVLTLPDAYEADVWFKLPMYLPSQVEFLTAQTGKDTEFAIRNSKNKKPHVAGKCESTLRLKPKSISV